MKQIIYIFIILFTLFSCKTNHVNEFYETHPENDISTAVNSFKIGDKTNILYELKPIKIYSDRANICLVLKIENNIEYGLYFKKYISSYLPSNNEQWNFTFHENGKRKYRKKL